MTAEHGRSFALVGKREVLLAGSIACPHCSRLLQASDVVIDTHDIALICSGCHKEVLVIRGMA